LLTLATYDQRARQAGEERLRALAEKEEREAQRLKAMQAGKGKHEDSAKKAAEAARRAEIVEVVLSNSSGGPQATQGSIISITHGHR